MTIDEVRGKYLAFFKERDHQIIPSASILPLDDPTTLFTGSGMQPLLPYLLGRAHPKGRRLANSQQSFRTEDIEEVGDNRHTTFFEMLGNWSLGDYFKKEQLSWFFDFLTAELGLDPNNLYVTVFAGDEANGIPRDNESVDIWRELFRLRGIEAKEVELLNEQRASDSGMQGGRIFYYGSEKNWWSRAGIPENMPEGEPGGPDSEVFYDFASNHDDKYGVHCHPNCDCGRFMEIGNSVFMEYLKSADGTFRELPQKNVDFGGGLERITAAVNNNPDIYEVDALQVLVRSIENATNGNYINTTYQKSFRIIADHMRGAVFMIAGGITPSNTEQGYVLRRLLREAVVNADKLKAPSNMLTHLVGLVASTYESIDDSLNSKSEQIEKVIKDEVHLFRQTLSRGLKEFDKLGHQNLSGYDAFVLATTFGFPIELTLELAKDRGVSVDIEGFKSLMESHKKQSRMGAVAKFKGGLADTSEMSVKYHTATHLLHRALIDVLGPEVRQKGSNITPERLRFDFTYGKKMTSKEISRVEDEINKKIEEGLAVNYKDMTKDEASRSGAIGLFDEKYDDVVRVYKIGDEINPYSLEYCGGPHVTNTKELGKFQIIKEEAISAGVRRIKAVLQ